MDVLAVPRKGEEIAIHRDICGKDFLRSHLEAFSDKLEINGFAQFQVTEVSHRFSAKGHEIEIGVEELMC